jgi:hypothetical protein
VTDWDESYPQGGTLGNYLNAIQARLVTLTRKPDWLGWNPYYFRDVFTNGSQISHVSFSEWINTQPLAAEYTSLISRLRIAKTKSIPSYSSERDNQCIVDWQWYFQQLDDLFLQTVVGTETLTSWAKTLKTVGDGSVSTACDGIPRLKLGSGSRTISSSYFSVVNEYTQTTKYFTYSIDSGDEDTFVWARRLPLPARVPQEPECELGVQLRTPRSIDDTPEHNKLCEELYSSYYAIERNPFNQASTAFEIESLRRKCPGRSECALDVGDEVVLIYWPPETKTSRDICDLGNDKIPTPIPFSISASRTLTTTAITFHGQDMMWDYACYGCNELFRDMKWNGTHWESHYPETDMPQFIKPAVLYGNFTFISPTVYLAHQAIATLTGTVPTTAFLNGGIWYGGAWIGEREQHPEGEVLSAGIIALHPNDVYSWRQKHLDGGLHNAQLMAQGQLRDPRPNKFSEIEGELARFDFDNLQAPVPAGVYFDARDDCFGTQSHCQTITEGDYRPKIVLKNAVWQSVLLKHWSCGHPGLFDPPIMLQPVTGIANPVIHPVGMKTAMLNDQPSPIMAAPGATIPVPLTRPTSRPSQGNDVGHGVSSQEGAQAGLGSNDRFGGARDKDQSHHSQDSKNSGSSSHGVGDQSVHNAHPKGPHRSENKAGEEGQAKSGGSGAENESVHKVGQQHQGGPRKDMGYDREYGAETDDKNGPRVGTSSRIGGQESGRTGELENGSEEQGSSRRLGGSEANEGSHDSWSGRTPKVSGRKKSMASANFPGSSVLKITLLFIVLFNT